MDIASHTVPATAVILWKGRAVFFLGVNEAIHERDNENHAYQTIIQFY
jgi:hypothetical protein